MLLEYKICIMYLTTVKHCSRLCFDAFFFASLCYVHNLRCGVSLCSKILVHNILSLSPYYITPQLENFMLLEYKICIMCLTTVKHCSRLCFDAFFLLHFVMFITYDVVFSLCSKILVHNILSLSPYYITPQLENFMLLEYKICIMCLTTVKHCSRLCFDAFFLLHFVMFITYDVVFSLCSKILVHNILSLSPRR